MDYNISLALFACANKSVKMKEIEEKLPEKWRKLKNVYKSGAGTNIAEANLKIMKRKISDDGNL